MPSVYNCQGQNQSTLLASSHNLIGHQLQNFSLRGTMSACHQQGIFRVYDHITISDTSSAQVLAGGSRCQLARGWQTMPGGATARARRRTCRRPGRCCWAPCTTLRTATPTTAATSPPADQVCCLFVEGSTSPQQGRSQTGSRAEYADQSCCLKRRINCRSVSHDSDLC